MNTHADRTQGNKSQSVANAVSQRQSNVESTYQFEDNRPEAIAQRKLQVIANDSPQTKQAAHLQEILNNNSINQQRSIQKKENNTGLPDNLKTGMENLSGMSLDNVKVHRASDKPAQLEARAYAQGTNIHLGPGQEKHLPHEAWHVVQQMQGRVKPTMHMKGKVNINDNTSLESEADRMGAASLNASTYSGRFIQKRSLQSVDQLVVQRVGGLAMGYNPDAISKTAIVFKAAVEKLFTLARNLNKIKKIQVTKDNLEKLTDINADASSTEKQKKDKRTNQVKVEYVNGLKKINLNPKFLTNILDKASWIAAWLPLAQAGNFLEKPAVKKIESDRNELIDALEVKEGDDEEKIVDKKWDGKGVQPEAKLLIGDDAFEKIKPENEEEKTRAIYKKLGKKGGSEEYVKDDLGNYTRRYAYMEKNYHQWMELQSKGVLSGKTQDMIGALTGKEVDEIDPLNFPNQSLDEDEQAIEDKYLTGKTDKIQKLKALAYMHQWKGSGSGQRGLSLTSTPKENSIFGNSGESFRSDDGAKIKIDLAKIKTDNILINHYRALVIDKKGKPNKTCLGGEKLEGATKIKTIWNKSKTRSRPKQVTNKYKYEESVLKNRELYLQYLPKEAIEEITIHEGEDEDRVIDVEDAATKFGDNEKNAINNYHVEETLKVLKIAHKKIEAGLENKKKDLEDTQKKLKNLLKTIRIKPSENQKMTQTREEKKDGYKKHNEALETEIQKLKEAQKNSQEAINKKEKEKKPKPDGRDIHGTKGYETGELYVTGYKAGLAYKSKAGDTEKSKRDYLFEAARNDRDKFTPYWKGFAAALKA